MEVHDASLAKYVNLFIFADEIRLDHSPTLPAQEPLESAGPSTFI